jgi:prolyl oligopeptidase
MLIDVGALDMVRFETAPNGEGNVPEFGSVKTEEGFKALFAMSSYHHVKDGVDYPPVLLSHGINDNRVPVWTSLKMAARLREAGARNVLLRLQFDSGHGAQETISDLVKRAAQNRSFYYWRAGFPEFQPKVGF